MAMVTCPAGAEQSEVAVGADGLGECVRGHRFERVEILRLIGCSFCGKRPPRVMLVHGASGIAICNECVPLATTILDGEADH